MRIDCLHGYFKFTETRPGQLAHFARVFGVELERSGDHHTFSDLVDAPELSIMGGTFLGCPTVKTFAGPPWEIMRENRLVYNFALGLVQPIDLILQRAKLSRAGDYFVSPGMILPGSVTDGGQRVKDYAAHYIEELAQFRYSGVGT